MKNYFLNLIEKTHILQNIYLKNKKIIYKSCSLEDKASANLFLAEPGILGFC